TIPAVAQFKHNVILRPRRRAKDLDNSSTKLQRQVFKQIQTPGLTARLARTILGEKLFAKSPSLKVPV
ncbi:MAG: hypothetical protein WA476_03070, partial [Acidobacteriaceae bacterium]